MPRDEYIDRALSRLRWKLWQNRMVQAMCVGAVASGIWILTIGGISLFIPLLYNGTKAWVGSAVLFGGSLLYSACRRPSLRDAAICGDALGMEDRLITYLEYRHCDSPMVLLFIEETKKALSVVQPVAHWHMCLNKKWLTYAVILLLVGISAWFVPAPAREAASDREKIDKRIQAEREHVQKLRNDISAAAEIHNRQQMEKTLASLQGELAHSTSYQEAAKAVADAKKAIVQGNAQGSGPLASVAYAMLQGTDFPDTGMSRTEMMQWARSLTGNDQVPFPNGVQQKMLQNVEKIKKDLNSSPVPDALQSAYEQLQNHQMTPSDLEKLLDVQSQVGMPAPETEKIAGKLEQIQERLLALDAAASEGKAGETPVSSLAFGNQSGLTNGEQVHTNGTEAIAAGGGGMQVRQSSNGTGGFGSAGQHKPATHPHNMVKGEEATRLAGTSSPSLLRGSLGKEGDIREREAVNVWAESGGSGPLGQAWATFQKNGMEYVNRQDIPLAREQVIEHYFAQLSGGKERVAGRDSNVSKNVSHD